ncbi:MAG: GNAT family N-acetyltransferase [Gemmatimonadaceae bacterium]
MVTTLTIRQPVATDAPVMADLLTQLGYPSNTAEIAERLLPLADHTHAVIFVAETDEKVVGVITAHTFPSLQATAPSAWITALVVDESFRGKHVGRELVSHVEQWVAERGAKRISVTSATRRSDAHAFYGSVGYTGSGLRLTKDL